jgi:exopolysaccharide/PEP-CTERM locus tyrosine autokinase
MTERSLQERIASSVRRPLGWVRRTIEKVRTFHPESNGAFAAEDGGHLSDDEVGGGLQFTQTRNVPVSRETFRRNRIVAMEEMSPVADQFKLLRTHLFHKTRPGGLNTIQITGFSTGEGKSLVAVNLAISIARDARQTTLLVDVDFRNPCIHALLGLGPETPGLKQHLLDGRPLEDLLISPGIDKLTVLPAGGRIPHSTELIGSPAMEALVAELKERYPDRYVIFDTPPIVECPDPLVFSEYVDAMILVARADHTRSEAVKAAMDLVPRQKVLGIVLNDMKTEN